MEQLALQPPEPPRQEVPPEQRDPQKAAEWLRSQGVHVVEKKPKPPTA